MVYIFMFFLYRQQRQTTARKLCHDTERFLKDLKDLPPPETPVSYDHEFQKYVFVRFNPQKGIWQKMYGNHATSSTVVNSL